MKNYVNIDIVDKGLCNNLKTYERRGMIRRLRINLYKCENTYK